MNFEQMYEFEMYSIHNQSVNQLHNLDKTTTTTPYNIPF